MKKRAFLIILFLAGVILPSVAVLKEKDLDNTLTILRTELIKCRTELERQSTFIQHQQEQMGKNLFAIMNRSNQNSLMLYSQKSEYIFDMTYACHEATEQYHEFQRNVMPFRKYLARTRNELARYDSLVNTLSAMPTRTLSERANIDRSVCLALAINIRRTLKDNSNQLSDYIRYYKMTEAHLKYLNDYADARYADIQSNIFVNAGDSYFKIIGALGENLREMSMTVTEKYQPQKKVKSQWDSRMIFGLLGMIIIVGTVSLLFNILLVRVLFTQLVKRNRLSKFYNRIFRKDDKLSLQESFLSKRLYIILTTTVVTFAVILGIVRVSWEQNFIIMACGLLVEFVWLLGVILISLLIRLGGHQIKSGFAIYLPLMVIGFITISFRIILIPNDLVNLIFPPTLLVCMLWQWQVIARYGKQVPKSDLFYAYLTLTVFIASVICSWLGYTLLSVQMLIWWIMQLTCILTITCIKGLLESYADRHELGTRPITQTWFYNLIYTVVLPTLGALSILISIYWAADVFNLSDTTRRIFLERIVDSNNMRISIWGITQVIILYFIFSYISSTLKELLRNHFEKADYSTAASKNVMARNVLQVVVWGTWLLVSLAIFHVNNTWLGYISVGFSTGVGFALKDILENIYYGISLMAGRIKVGDWIEVDGKRGKVSSISYTSTQVDTIDGSVMAFQNSQLFTKNYKNLTKNHGYELAVIPIGVAYGTNANQVKEIIVNAITPLACRDHTKEVKVVFAEFGDNSINFKIIVWIPVLTQTYAKGEIMEAVYNALNDHRIEIPFPQRDIHIITSTNPA